MDSSDPEEGGSFYDIVSSGPLLKLLNDRAQ
jgi:hypothetical protein